ncbi:hypothetical protein KGF57_000766 [Candida theae]|uniref:Major facilitator superfamily (MFS) profile domain-containing protein n=1 Tax=Candida theae TaxID=1198502 RepID=A0AAD5BJ13_9ASCO|nr:uncharacterized protein KGF57_000766 [Candida theae]KAI5965500.1 hypothetical protein KGF57_000766 [Candida theae]
MSKNELTPSSSSVKSSDSSGVPKPLTGNIIDQQPPRQLPEDLEDQTSSHSHHFKESDAGDGTLREDQYIHGTRLMLCFVSLFLCLFLFALDQTIVATILSTVGNKFNAFENVGWLSSGFLLTMAVFIQPYGKLSIIFGRKWSMVVAVVIFEAGSLMCALAPTMNVLIGGRVLAGIGGAGIQGLTFVIVSEVVPINKRPVGMTILSVTFAVASVLGPLIGGAFTTHVTWRWSFYINLPVGGFALAVFLYSFRPPFPRVDIWQELKAFDYIGTFFFISGSVIFLLAITFGASDFAWDSGAVISCFVLGPVLLIFFAVWNFRFSKNQIIGTDVITTPQIIASALSISGVFSAFIVTMIYASVYFQVIRDSSAMGAGLHLLPCIIAVVICSIISGGTIQKSRYVKPWGIFSGVMAPIGAGLLSLLRVDSPFSKQVGLLIVMGIATGCQFQPAIISAQIKAPKTPGGTIMTTIFVNASRCLSSAIAATLSDAVYTASLKNHFKNAIPKASPQIQQALQSIDLSSLMSNNTILKTLDPVTERFIKEQMMKSIQNVFYMCIGFAAISTLACPFITNKRLPDMKKMAKKEEKKEEIIQGDATEAEKEAQLKQLDTEPVLSIPEAELNEEKNLETK